MKVLDKTASLRDQVQRAIAAAPPTLARPAFFTRLVPRAPASYSSRCAISLFVRQAKYQEERNIMALSDSHWITRTLAATLAMPC